MSHTLRVQATDDVYKMTKEKMTLVDNEVKKVRCVTVLVVVIITSAKLVIITLYFHICSVYFPVMHFCI